MCYCAHAFPHLAVDVGLCMHVMLNIGLSITHVHELQGWKGLDTSSPNFHLQTPRVAKIQVQATWPSMDLLQVPLNPSTRVTHVLKLFTEHLSPGPQPEEGSENPNSLLSQ